MKFMHNGAVSMITDATYVRMCTCSVVAYIRMYVCTLARQSLEASAYA